MVYILRPTSIDFKWGKVDGLFGDATKKKNAGTPLTASSFVR